MTAIQGLCAYRAAKLGLGPWPTRSAGPNSENQKQAPASTGEWSRRAWLASLGAAALPMLSRAAVEAPASRVAIARCPSYGSPLGESLSTLFDQLGGLAPLVRGKVVGVKVNLTGSPLQRLGHVPTQYAQYTHPAVIGHTVRLLHAAGASRVRLLEGCFACGDPMEEFILQAGWDAQALLNAAPRVEMENTNVLGRAKQYARMNVPGTGYVFPAFDLNHSYNDVDVMVSIAKLKEHATCGVTLSMKNMFGITPITIYGDYAGKDEPAPEASAGRGAVMHAAMRPPSKSAPQELNHGLPKIDHLRVPRIVVDLNRARPVHLAIIDGIRTMAGGEGPWIPGSRAIEPGLLVAGLNSVCTDAVATALMGFDPMATHGTAPFERCDSTLELAEAKGLGTRDLKRIEVIGGRIEDLKTNFRRRA